MLVIYRLCLKKTDLREYIKYGMMLHNVVLPKMEFFQCYLKDI